MVLKRIQKNDLSSIFFFATRTLRHKVSQRAIPLHLAPAGASHLMPEAFAPFKVTITSKFVLNNYTNYLKLHVFIL
jgi:hypothetical protein